MKIDLRDLARKTLQRLGLFGATFRLHEAIKARRQDSEEPVAAAADGLPLPPAKMIVLVEGHANAAKFLRGGEAISRTIRTMLAAHGAPVERMKAILDFGCGCGRVMRHWQALHRDVALHGSDYNRTLVEWCRTNLPFARFGVNRLEPPLDHADGAFDLVYANSVFTHLPENLQLAWIDELIRVTAPGGHILVTLHGESFRESMTADEQAAFDRGELVVRYPKMSGSNLCAAFHPQRYVRESLARQLEILEYAPAKLSQDVVLFRRK